jgi:transposase
MVSKRTSVTEVNKLQVLIAIQQGKGLNYQMLAEQFPVTPKTISRWLKCYEAEGLRGILREKRGEKCVSELAHARDSSGISLREAIAERLNATENAPHSYKGLHQELQVRFGFKSGYTPFYKYVKRYFPDARLKRPRPSHVQKPKDAEERAKKN